MPRSALSRARATSGARASPSLAGSGYHALQASSRASCHSSGSKMATRISSRATSAAWSSSLLCFCRSSTRMPSPAPRTFGSTLRDATVSGYTSACGYVDPSSTSSSRRNGGSDWMRAISCGTTLSHVLTGMRREENPSRSASRAAGKPLASSSHSVMRRRRSCMSEPVGADVVDVEMEPRPSAMA